MFNNWIGIGRLTMDPELRYTTTGKPVCNFTVAVNRRYGDEVDFIKVTSWGNSAEACAEYITKGSLVAVSGELQIQKYKTQDGSNKVSPTINASVVKFLDARPANDNGDASTYVDDENWSDVPF